MFRRKKKRVVMKGFYDGCDVAVVTAKEMIAGNRKRLCRP